jgi:UTP--glucose-1-phosphate uridylyltransferase
MEEMEMGEMEMEEMEMGEMEKKIKKVVIPVAGLGTRFLPATKSIPKEMIPIVDTPMIQYIIEEAVRAGIEDVILVTARHKEAIENHFDINAELDHFLEERGKTELLEISRRVGRLCNVIAIRQKEPLGLGHAILAAAPAVGDEPFAVLLGDDLIDSEIPCIQQLIDVYEKHKQSVVGVMRVPKSEVSKYGIVAGKLIEEKLLEVSHLVEKPSADEAPSTYAIPGRYVLSSKVFDYIRETAPGKGGEIQLTDALHLLAQNEGLLAFEFNGTRYDTGDKLGYLDATLNFALRRPELKEGVEKLLIKYAAQVKMS